MTAGLAAIVILACFTKVGQTLLLIGLGLLVMRRLLPRKAPPPDPRITDALDSAEREARAMRYDGVVKATRWAAFVNRHAGKLGKLGLTRDDAIAELKRVCGQSVPKEFAREWRSRSAGPC